MALSSSQKVIAGLIGVLLLVLAVAGGGFLIRSVMIKDPSNNASHVKALGDSFPVPVGAEVEVPPSAGINPPSSARTWQMNASLDDACTQWRDSFRSWLGSTPQDDVSGSVEPGVSCTFKARHQNSDVDLQIAKVGETNPIVTLNIVEVVS